MPRLRVLSHALKARAEKLLGRAKNPFADVPPGLALSPSDRHFKNLENAPRSLRFAATDRESTLKWQETARAKLAELTGYNLERGARPNVSHESRFPLPGGLCRRRLYLRAREGVDIPVHLIEAPRKTSSRPVMICLQGTNTGAHLSWGEVRFPTDYDNRARGYDIAIQAARRGYLAVAIEQTCFGERFERGFAKGKNAGTVEAHLRALLTGRTIMGEICADISAVIDWLAAEARNLSIAEDTIHIMGHSLGGTAAVHAAALDPRISAVLACGCIGYIRETSGKRADTSGTQSIPGLLNWLEMPDIVGLIAPRPFVTVAGIEDHIWPASGAVKVVEEARAVWQLLGSPRKIAAISDKGGHTFRPDLSWRGFEAALSSN